MTSAELIEKAREDAKGLGPKSCTLIMALTDRLEAAERRVTATPLEMGKKAEPEPGRAVHILGSLWCILERSEQEDERLKDCDGYCDWTTRQIVVERELHGTLGDMEKYIRKVTRHEIVHAFLFESGLAECSGEVEAWARNEAMVDWIANQGQKVYAAWKEAGALDV